MFTRREKISRASNNADKRFVRSFIYEESFLVSAAKQRRASTQKTTESLNSSDASTCAFINEHATPLFSATAATV